MIHNQDENGEDRHAESYAKEERTKGRVEQQADGASNFASSIKV